MKKLLSAAVLTIISCAVSAEEAFPQSFGDRILFEGEVVSEKFLHDGLNFSTAIHLLLIRFEGKFYMCTVDHKRRYCITRGEKYGLFD